MKTISERRYKRLIAADETCKAFRSAIANCVSDPSYRKQWNFAAALLTTRWMPLAGKESFAEPSIKPVRRK